MFSLTPANAFAVAASDISGHWAQVEIQSWMDQGLIKGYPDGTFKPDQHVTRAEFMTLANRAFGYTTVVPITYTDVQADAWYTNAIAIAKAAGYVSGYPDNTMKPQNPITREEVATIVARIKNLTSAANAADKYTDASKIGSWSKGQVGAVTSAKIMQGYPVGSFMPQGLMTRAEVVVASDNTLHYTASVATIAVRAITVTPTTMALTAGGTTGAITATVGPSNATNKIVTWSSSNAAVATVAGGVVTPIGAGTATITVTTADGGKTATCTVTVTAPIVSGGSAPLTVVTPITSADVAVKQGSIDFTFSFFAGSTTPITFAEAQASLYCLDPPSSTVQLRFGSNDTSPVSLEGLHINEAGELSYATFGNMATAFGWNFQNIPTDFRLSLGCGNDPTVSNPWTRDTGWLQFSPEEENIFALYGDEYSLFIKNSSGVPISGDALASITDNKLMLDSTSTFGGSTITWASNNTGVIANDGTVTRPAFGTGNATVTLTATITKGTLTETKVFTLTVLAETAPTYTVTFDSQGGTPTPDPITGIASGAVVTMPTAPTKTGNTFARWNTAADGTGTAFAADTAVTASITVFAQWTINQYTVTFKDYDGTTVLGTDTVDYNTVATAPSNPTRTGYTFAGWDVAFTNVVANMTVTATYTINSYTVTFDKNGGDTDADPTTRTADYNTTVTLPTAPTKTGYAFASWNTVALGGGTTFNASTHVIANVTVYAQWLSSDATLLGGTLGGVSLSGTFTGAAMIGMSSGSSVTVTAGDQALVLTKGNANSTIKYVVLQKITDVPASPQPANNAAYTQTYSDSTIINIASSNDRIWLRVTAQDGITIRYCWIIVTAAQSGSPALTAGTPATFGTPLTVGAGSLTTTTNLTYTWYRSVDAVVGSDTLLTTGLTYTPVAADIGNYLIVLVTSTDATGTGFVVTAATVVKADGPAAPGAPILASKTSTSVTLTANALNEFSKDGSTWQGEVFSGLTASTAYTFTARVKETATTNASGASGGTGITTLGLATLTTTAASAITSTTATSGGNVTADGDATITARGVCWSASTSPTTALSTKTTEDGTTGTFTSSITGLTLGSTYYVRAYATNSIGTAYGNEVSFATALAIGDNYGGGIVAYILQSGDPGYVSGVTKGLIAATEDQSTGIRWAIGSEIQTWATGTALGTGNANTNTIVGNQGAGSYAARLCYDLTLNSYSDWYLPSKDELNKLFINQGTIEGFSAGLYWSSTETSNAQAWAQNFSGVGTTGNYSKDSTYYVRAVRTFPSSDATLKTSSTVKGQAIGSLGTPNATLGSETAGAVTITAAKAADTTGLTTFITLFDPTDAGTAVKVVKYAFGGSTAGFAADAAYADAAITDADFFIVRVTAADATALYYKVVVTLIFSIGDSYGGGIIAYIDGSGQHGLIAATADQSTAEWSNIHNSSVGSTGTLIGTGQANTTAIVHQSGFTGGAAKLCTDLVVGGIYSDWYLPSKDELAQLYLNKDTIGSFVSGGYWSSSETAANTAWAQGFNDGSWVSSAKTSVINVRAVRSF